MPHLIALFLSLLDRISPRQSFHHSCSSSSPSSPSSSSPFSSSLYFPHSSTSLPTTKTFAPSNYTVLTGFFKQDERDFDGVGYDALSDSLGLIDKSPTRWTNFAQTINDLNHHADDFTAYKVIYMARHGEGYHNVAEESYGTAAWNCYWSEQTTDGNITWGPDALLTSIGEGTSYRANAFFKTQTIDGFPLPQTLYTSPLRRAASTLNITWNDVLLDKPGHSPRIKENLREVIGLHTCDQRSNKTVIAATYPNYTFDPSFTEHDQLWNHVYQESNGQQALRIQQFLNELFATDDSTYISITAHGGVINGFFTAIGHRPISVQTGGIVPVVVKAISYPTATNAIITGGQSATAPTCTADPTAAMRS